MLQTCFININGIRTSSLASRNTNVVTVKSGVVQGKKVGTADVSCIVNGSSSIIFNDETIFIYINQNGFNNETLKKYELTPQEINIYNQKQNENK